MSSIILMGIIDQIMQKIASIDDLLKNPITSSFSPYTAVLGNFTYAFMWFFISGMIYLKTNNIMSVVVVWFVFFTIYMPLFMAIPFLVQMFAIISAMALTGLLYTFFIKRR